MDVASENVPFLGRVLIIYQLNVLGKQYDLSSNLISCMRKIMKEQQKIAEWNTRDSVNGRSFNRGYC